MAVFYFDANAVVKYYILEPGSTWVRGLVDLRNPSDLTRINSVVISDASLAESAAAFSILYRTNRISRKTLSSAYQNCTNDIARGLFGPIPLKTEDFRLAASLTQRYPLKAYDATQLAVAKRYWQTLMTRQLSMTFVTGDKTLITAAQAEGLVTDNPFDHIVPQDTPVSPPPSRS